MQRDLDEKYELYEKSGVKEYWIVHPNDIASEMTGGTVNHDDIRKDEFRALKDVSFKCQRRVWKTSKLNNTVTLKTQRPTTPSL